MLRKAGIGDRFQRDTNTHRDREFKEPYKIRRQPDPVKKYRWAKTVRLERPRISGGPAIWKTIKSRRSSREYGKKPMKRADLSQLLWAAQGVAGKLRDIKLRTAPSAGALYPVETYVICHAVDKVPAGIYHYGVEKHQLERVEEGDFRDAVSAAALDQAIARDAAAVFAWSAVFDRAKFKYGQRAYRYIYLDAGHIAQNLALAAEALGHKSCPIAAIYDDEMNALIGIDGKKESVIYLTAVGTT
jgi:SagB-type dehydrogenase family enzyme